MIRGLLEGKYFELKWLPHTFLLAVICMVTVIGYSRGLSFLPPNLCTSKYNINLKLLQPNKTVKLVTHGILEDFNFESSRFPFLRYLKPNPHSHVASPMHPISKSFQSPSKPWIMPEAADDLGRKCFQHFLHEEGSSVATLCVLLWLRISDCDLSKPSLVVVLFLPCHFDSNYIVISEISVCN